MNSEILGKGNTSKNQLEDKGSIKFWGFLCFVCLLKLMHYNFDGSDLAFSVNSGARLRVSTQ